MGLGWPPGNPNAQRCRPGLVMKLAWAACPRNPLISLVCRSHRTLRAPVSAKAPHAGRQGWLLGPPDRERARRPAPTVKRSYLGRNGGSAGLVPSWAVPPRSARMEQQRRPPGPQNASSSQQQQQQPRGQQVSPQDVATPQVLPPVALGPGHLPLATTSQPLTAQRKQPEPPAGAHLYVNKPWSPKGVLTDRSLSRPPPVVFTSEPLPCDRLP